MATDSGSRVKVAVRVRPLSNKEKNENQKSIIKIDRDCSPNELIIESKDSAGREFTKTYVFDHVFDEENDQIGIYEECASPIIESVLKGYNGTIFCYGQTGTGKTYIMEGDIHSDKNKGIIPRTFTQIMEHINKSNENIQFLVHISFLEIYQDEVYDLLTKNKRKKMAVKEGKNGFYVKDLSKIPVKSVKDMTKILRKGQKKRAVRATIMSPNSSRSHCILSITIQSSWKGDDNSNHSIMSKLNLVDLAGVDRQKNSQIIGDMSNEVKFINLSLSALGNVINALSNKKASHIPYRDSKLTRLLSNSLGGNTKTVMIANIAPCSNNLDETMSTLRYANWAINIKNKPRINGDQKDAMTRKKKKHLKGEKTANDYKQKKVASGRDVLKIEDPFKSKPIDAYSKDEEKYEIARIQTEKTGKIGKEKAVMVAKMKEPEQNKLFSEKCEISGKNNEENNKQNKICTISEKKIVKKENPFKLKLTDECSKDEEKYEITGKIDHEEKEKDSMIPKMSRESQKQSGNDHKAKKLTVSERRLISYTYCDIIQEMIKLIDQNKNRFSLLKTATDITGPDKMEENECCNDNFWNIIRNGKFEMRLDLSYDEWMSDKQKYETKVINEISEILNHESTQITIDNYRRGSVRFTPFIANVWKWWKTHIRKIGSTASSNIRDYIRNMRVYDQICVKYKNVWYNATISKALDDGNSKHFQVRYNPIKDSDGSDPFFWNTEWFYGGNEASRLRFDGQIYQLQNEEGERYDIKWPSQQLAKPFNSNGLQVNDHIFVKFDKEGWSRCIVFKLLSYNNINNYFIDVKNLKSGDTKRVEWSESWRKEVSFRDMRDI